MPNRSNYPVSIDTFADRADISPSDRTNLLRYQELVIKADKTPEEITELSALTATLGTKLFNAEVPNKMQDSIANTQTSIGLLANLGTTVKTSIVGAINSFIGVIGDLSTLATTVKTSLVASINEIINTWIPKLALKNTEVVLRTTAYSLGLSDVAVLQKVLSASQVNVTIPNTVTFDLYSEVPFVMYGAGKPHFIVESGLTLKSADSKVDVEKQYKTCVLKYMGNSEWLLFGSLA